MLVKVDVSVTFSQTSHRLPEHLQEPAVLSNGYNEFPGTTESYHGSRRKDSLSFLAHV